MAAYPTVCLFICCLVAYGWYSLPVAISTVSQPLSWYFLLLSYPKVPCSRYPGIHFCFHPPLLDWRWQMVTGAKLLLLNQYTAKNYLLYMLQYLTFFQRSPEDKWWIKWITQLKPTIALHMRGVKKKWGSPSPQRKLVHRKKTSRLAVIIYVEREPQKHHPGLPSGSSAPSTSFLKFRASFGVERDEGRGLVGLVWVEPAVRDMKFLRTAAANLRRCNPDQ